MNSQPLSTDLQHEIDRAVEQALQEDVGSGDLTANLIPINKSGNATVISREPAVLCGGPWFEAAFRHLAPETQIVWHAPEGARVEVNQVLCEITGNARALLTGERTALNFLQMLSATATRTSTYVDAIKGLKAAIVDTRKTIPGLRLAQKYAVRIGGGKNHRIGLYDGVLIKENHIMAAGGIGPALKAAEISAPTGVMIMVEVEALSDLVEALDQGAKLILLDNFTIAQLSEAVQINGGRAELEASGGVDLQTVRAIAETGVDRISIGTLTKDVKAIDLSMRFKA
ncbi:MAG: carboxylating nicotinate-nucleotide diphosphorylase [Pseudomonadota bacterium]